MRYMAILGDFFVWARFTWKRLSDQTGGFNITVSLTLFLFWVIFNMLDIVISLLAIRAGAIEIGILYQFSNDFLAASINKMMLAILIGIILVYARKTSWLSLCNLGMVGLCIYNGFVLLKVLQ